MKEKTRNKSVDYLFESIGAICKYKINQRVGRGFNCFGVAFR